MDSLVNNTQEDYPISSTVKFSQVVQAASIVATNGHLTICMQPCACAAINPLKPNGQFRTIVWWDQPLDVANSMHLHWSHLWEGGRRPPAGAIVMQKPLSSLNLWLCRFRARAAFLHPNAIRGVFGIINRVFFREGRCPWSCFLLVKSCL